MVFYWKSCFIHDKATIVIIKKKPWQWSILKNMQTLNVQIIKINLVNESPLDERWGFAHLTY